MAGLDLVRLVAVLLVTAEHALTLTGHDPWTFIGPVDVGQMGVSFFLGVSGYLSLRSAKRPTPWLVERTRRLYPAYAIVMCVSFLLTWASGYRSFGPFQFISQMLMLGLFTHPSNLVNLPTWFMSLLLMGYLGIFLVRLVGRASTTIWIVAGLVLGLNTWAGQKWPWFELSTFFVAAGLGILEPGRSGPIWLAAAAFLGLALWSPLLCYTGIVLAGIALARRVRRLPAPISVAARYVYEYYLIHGVVLVGFLAILSAHPVVGVCLAVIAASAAAVALKAATEYVLA